MEFPDGLKYTESHEWAKLKDGKVRCGITEFAADELGDIVFLDLPDVGTETQQDQPIGEIESVKAVADIKSPVSGKVVEVNQALMDAPDLVGEDPYEAAWMLVIEPSDPSELDSLMDAEQYARHCEGEA